MAGKNDTSKTGSTGQSVGGHATSQHINNIQKSQGPAVHYDPTGVGGFEQRNTMKPKGGMKHVQQKALEKKLENFEEGREHEQTVDLEMHGEREDEKQMPVPPAEKKAGMRK